MKISTKGRYALRIMIDLAENANGEYIRLKDISARQGSQLATAFHSELNDDTSVHAYFVEMIKGSKAQAV